MSTPDRKYLAPDAKLCPTCGSPEPGARGDVWKPTTTGQQVVGLCPDPFHGPPYTPDRRPGDPGGTVAAMLCPACGSRHPHVRYISIFGGVPCQDPFHGPNGCLVPEMTGTHPDSARLDKLERLLVASARRTLALVVKPGFMLTEYAGIIVLGEPGRAAKPTLREAIDDAEEPA